MTRWIGALAVLAVLAIAGCGSSSDNSSGGSAASGSGSSGSGSSSSSTTSSSGNGHTLKLAADPSGQLKFDTTQLKAKAGTVTIDFTNQSPLPHAVAVEGNGVDKDGKIIKGGSNSLTLKLKPGTYTFYCPVPGHKAAGMKGTLVVQ